MFVENDKLVNLDAFKVYRVPSSDAEALQPPLMGLFEKRRMYKFYLYVQNYDENNLQTQEGLDLYTMTAKELFV